MVPLRAALAPLALAGALLLGACGGDEAATDATAPPSRDGVVATGLETPWAVARAGDVLLVTERAGRVRAIRDGALLPEPVAEPEAEEIGEAGLLGVAVHPDGGSVYLYATAGGENRITRHPLRDGGSAGVRLGPGEVILAGIPAAAVHNGGGLAFGPDGRLYAGAGDAGDPGRAADPRSPGGAILRLEDDGAIPADNPFPGSPVWAYGLRNPQGLAWDAEGNMYASDHGPSGEFGLCCLDELNRIERGGFYGWPARAGDRDAAGPDGVPDGARPIDPIATSGPDDTWAPGGIAVVQSDAGPLVVMGTLAGRALRAFAIAPDDPGRVTAERVLLEGEGRLRAVMADGDGCVLVTTSNRDGRGDPGPGDDRILRTCPEAG